MEEGAMEPVSRRTFLGTASVLGVAGLAGATGVAAITGSDTQEKEPELTSEEIESLTVPVVLQVQDAEAGEVELLVADKSIVFTDKALVAKLLRAVR
jgi:hypothetical protein